MFQVTTALEAWIATFLFPHVHVHRIIHGCGEDVERVLQRTQRVSGPESKSEQ